MKVFCGECHKQIEDVSLNATYLSDFFLDKQASEIVRLIEGEFSPYYSQFDNSLKNFYLFYNFGSNHHAIICSNCNHNKGITTTLDNPEFGFKRVINLKEKEDRETIFTATTKKWFMDFFNKDRLHSVKYMGKDICGINEGLMAVDEYTIPQNGNINEYVDCNWINGYYPKGSHRPDIAVIDKHACLIGDKEHEVCFVIEINYKNPKSVADWSFYNTNKILCFEINTTLDGGGSSAIVPYLKLDDYNPSYLNVDYDLGYWKPKYLNTNYEYLFC